MRLIQLAQCPSPCVDQRDSVLDAVHVMERAHTGCAAVMEDGRLVGVISERDVMLRVVATDKSAKTTKVRDVMTPTVKTVSPECRPDEAIALMVANHIRHVVLVNERGGVVGIASSRDIYQAHVESLDDQVRSLEAFAGADGIGG